MKKSIKTKLMKKNLAGNMDKKKRLKINYLK